MSGPTVAVVIPVLNEAGNIAGLLEDLGRQRRRPDAVVVVDAGSTDGTREVVAGLAIEPRPQVLLRPGAAPGAGRNAGVAAAGTDIVATVDAGSRVGPGWLEALAGPVLESPDAVATGVAVSDAHTSFERAAGWFTLRAFKPADAPGPVGGGFRPAGRNGLCFSTAAWTRAGGYPEDLPWAEDKRFLESLRATGCVVHFAPGAEVRWRPRSTPAEIARQYHRYGRGDAMARIDRQNELVTLAIWTAGAALAARSAGGHRGSAALLAASAAGYLGIFTAAAARELDDPRAIAWVPGIRLIVDVAKVSGFLAQSLRELSIRRV